MLLAIETSDRLCGVCLLETGTQKIIATKTIDIGKGHAELLMGVIEDVLAQANAKYSDLSAVAVCVGPGSFTGIRVGVSAAIGFSIALNIPVLGVTSLQALAFQCLPQSLEVLCLIDAHRGDVYAQTFSCEGLPLDAPRQVALEELAQLPSFRQKYICGSGALLLQTSLPDLKAAPVLPSVESLALASQNLVCRVSAKPLYLRRPDAKPQESYTIARALRS